MTTQTDPIYHHGRSPEETRRLMDQAALYDGHFRRMLEEAGIRRGMTVLDVGSGAGDTAMLAARLVGPEGHVTGVDQNPEILGTARSRAAAAGLEHVEFVEGDIRTVDLPRAFDAAIGRLVLMYTADPGAALETIAGRVRSGGVVAFQELDVALFSADRDAMPVLARFVQLGIDLGARGGAHAYLGQQLHSLYLAAGLPAPEMWGFIPMGAAAGWPGFTYMASNFRTALPVIEQLGLGTAAELDVETLAGRFEEEASRVGMPLQCPPLVTAWSRKP